MFGSEKCERERIEFLEKLVVRLFDVIDQLLALGRIPASNAVSAKGKLDSMNNATKITFTEFDVNGKIVPIPAGRQITFNSDNLFAATVDSTQQTLNADGSVSCPVISLTDGPGGNANITGVDPATLGPDGKPLAAGDVDTVVPATLPAVKATAVLS